MRKLLIAATAAVMALAGAASADSAFADGFANSITDLELSGSGSFSTLDTGISTGPWSNASNAGLNFTADLDADNNVDVSASALETSSFFGADEALADVVIDNDSDLSGTFQFVGIGQDVGTGGSFGSASGGLNFDFDVDGFGFGSADANDN